MRVHASRVAIHCEAPIRVPDCRCISPSPGKTTSITYSLPLKELRGEGVPIGPFFAEEFFLRAPNEDRAWSGSPMYDINSGAATVRCDHLWPPPRPPWSEIRGCVCWECLL